MVAWYSGDTVFEGPVLAVFTTLRTFLARIYHFITVYYSWLDQNRLHPVASLSRIISFS